MPARDPKAARVQVYIADPQLLAALEREASAQQSTLSHAAGRAIARGLSRSPTADPDDRLLKLERSLRQHMGATARDMAVVEELVVQLARLLLLRLPETELDRDPLMQASVEARLERLLDDTVFHVVRGGRRAKESAPPQDADGFAEAAQAS
jgi:hypothetical protein